MVQPIYITLEGFRKTESELKHFRSARRQDIADRIQKASSIGGTVDNAEYDEAKNEQAFIEGRILTLENTINNAVMIETDNESTGTIRVGSKVSIVDKSNKKREEYLIVGIPEADPSNGKISNVSPIGKALIGKQTGDIAQVKAPVGIIKLEILAVK